MFSIPIILVIFGLVVLFKGIRIIQQGTVGVVTTLGKFSNVIYPGLNIVIPFVQNVSRISTQNKSVEMDFQATTQDQANVYFKAMLLFSVQNEESATIQKVAFKFVDERNLMTALIRTVEGSIRSFVATKKQSEVLSLRGEIIRDVKENLDHQLEEWGYHLLDLQVNDITFDQTIMESMAKVVSSNNLKAAAENEGQALLITKTKAAEADGHAIRISAEAERVAAQLRGQGVALFREEVARGMAQAADEMRSANLDISVIMFSMWTESIKHFAESGKGNMIFLDGSTDGMNRAMQQLMGMQSAAYNKMVDDDTRKSGK
jgi:regulator of protease activity HflC (stomatin/prohibitin superfamily)